VEPREAPENLLFQPRLLKVRVNMPHSLLLLHDTLNRESVNRSACVIDAVTASARVRSGAALLVLYTGIEDFSPDCFVTRISRVHGPVAEAE
jgi:hypothetical protein